MSVKLAIGSDHRGYKLKEFLLSQGVMADRTIIWKDVGCFSDERCDYPVYAQAVVEQMRLCKVDAGILLCGTGVGMAMAANRYRGMYAGVCWNPIIAARAKEEDNVTILVLPADYLDNQEALACVVAWMQASFKKHEARYVNRLHMIDR